MRTLVLALTLLPPLLAADDPAYPHLSRAYQFLQQRSYEQAIASFQTAIAIAPSPSGPRQDLAYTYLKIGERDRARDQFAAVMQLEPENRQAALEFAYLAYETGRRAEARRVFQRWDAAAFESVDRPLREGIARWQAIVERSPDNFSAHQELAKLAAERDDFGLASAHFREAWRLRPDIRSLLVDLGEAERSRGREEEAMAALVAASRGPEPYSAERARALLPDRYPYVYEFERGIELDPANEALRREHAYLLLAMGRREEAVRAFRRNVQLFPGDHLSAAQLGLIEFKEGDRSEGLRLLKRVYEGPDAELRRRVAPVVLPELARLDRELGLRSLQAGYLKDAIRFLTSAYETNPKDYEVMLKLGWAHNMLKQDQHAVEWFRLASRSPEQGVATEAKRAYRNLNPGPLRTTVWLFPMWSSRWDSAFGYGQAKVEYLRRGWKLRPYLSVRFAGDSRGQIGVSQPQYLSESSFILGVGVATRTWNRVTAYAEAGVSVPYLRGQATIPDYRAGVNYAKGWGHALDGESKGWFVDTLNDAVFLSRFGNDTLLMTQNRAGWTFGRAQAFWGVNLTTDLRRQAWANFSENGPGVRVRLAPRVHVTASGWSGRFLREPVTPFGRTYSDVRIGLWYAFTR
jgi:Flp pilus assembly protein TadD